MQAKTDLTNCKRLFPKNWLLLVLFFYPLLILAQPCTTTQFSKGYQFDGFGAGYFFERTKGGELYFGGIKNYNMVLSTADSDGNLLWSKQYEHDFAEVYSNYGLASIDSNGNYFVNIDAECIGLLDPNGTPLDAKEMKIPYDNVFGTCVGILRDNKKLILVDDQSTYGAEGYMLLCLSADLSTVIWNKHFSGWNTYFREFAIVEDKIFVTGMFQYNGTLLCFDAATGNLLNKRFYNIDNKQTYLDKIHAYKNGYIIQARYYGGETNNHLIIRLDQNLNVLNSYRFVNIWDNASLALAAESDGSFYGAWSAGGFGHYRFYMSNQDSVLWNRATSLLVLLIPNSS
jgi:outer membrane protein assembly factor BamB